MREGSNQLKELELKVQAKRIAYDFISDSHLKMAFALAKSKTVSKLLWERCKDLRKRVDKESKPLYTSPY